MADPGLAALTAVSTLIGFGAEMAFWPQDVLLQSSMETCGSGRPSATFATTLALSSAVATASVGVWAEERGLAAGLSLAALAYAAAAVPLLWYHEGHMERHLPTAGSLLAELRRVRGEYAFRSDAMRHALTGLHVESYWTAILPLIFLANAGPPPWLGYVVAGASVLSLVLQWARGAGFDAGRARTSLPSRPWSRGRPRPCSRSSLPTPSPSASWTR